jgi:hypothetical protein
MPMQPAVQLNDAAALIIARLGALLLSCAAGTNRRPSARRGKRGRARRCLGAGAPSACARSAHQLKRRFDVPPSFSLFALALLFQGASLLSGLDNGFVAAGLQQLARVLVDVDFLHSHDIVLLFVRAAATADGNRAR